MDDVLLLHNTFGDEKDPLYMSRAGVMDQVNAVAESLNSIGVKYEVAAVENIKNLTELLGGYRQKLIFNLAEEFLCAIDQACYVPAICKAFGKSCTGNDTSALLLGQNKINAKNLFLGAGLECPVGTVINPNQLIAIEGLKPDTYFIKPAFCDASEGITEESVVVLPEEIDRAAKLIKKLHLRFNQPVIIERYIPHRELNVSVMQDGDKVRVLAIAEIDFSAFAPDQSRIVDYSAKWEEGSFGYENTPRKIPADLTEAQYEKVEQMALSAWRALGCRDYTRVDFRMDNDNNPYVLEINPNPDISLVGGFAAALEYASIPYKSFVETMLNNAAERLGN